MTLQELDRWLASTLEDQRLSRAERQSLRAQVDGFGPDVDLELLRHRAFELARSALPGSDALPVLAWLEDVVKTLRDAGTAPHRQALAEAYFSPGEGCVHAIERLLANARSSADICVFTITDDRLARAILQAHSRDVKVRIITDDEKAQDLGSDIMLLERAGIPLRADRSPFHMHHKFAVVDGDTVLTGSYNWTRGAAHDNEENLIVTNDPRFVSAFAERFEQIWSRLG